MTLAAQVCRLRAAAVCAVVLALNVTSGCFWQHRSGPDTPPVSEVALSVTNHYKLDVVVYVVHDGQRTRVGTVTASSTQTFILPPWQIGQGREVQLLGHPIGGAEVAETELLIVQPGQRIEWTLESSLSRSSVAVI